MSFDDDQLKERIIKTQSVFTGKIFSVETLDVELFDGRCASREIVRHRGGAAVIAIQDGKVCLVKQYRVALGRTTLEIPAGKIEPGESGKECAMRELAEESGIKAAELELITSACGSPGFTDEHTDIYFAKDLSKSTATPDVDENISCVWLPLEDALAYIRSGKIQDAKTIIAIFAVAAKLV